jgi:hypothetical protein
VSREDEDKEVPSWAAHFRISPGVELDFIISQRVGWPVGMPRGSTPEFKRRILAAATSYQAQLKSIDYAKKRYVPPELFEDQGKDILLGDASSDYLKETIQTLIKGLFNLHTADTSAFGIFGSEITLYRVPYAIDMVRVMANRGLLLEAIPTMRLCIEMIAWANAAFSIEDDDNVVALKAQNCIPLLKAIYEPAGKIYGYFSRFAHWGHIIHGQFIGLKDGETSVVYASPRYRAMTLALCLVVVDVLVEVVRALYGEKSAPLVLAVQECQARDSKRKIFKMISDMVENTQLKELREIQSLLA